MMNGQFKLMAHQWSMVSRWAHVRLLPAQTPWKHTICSKMVQTKRTEHVWAAAVWAEQGKGCAEYGIVQPE